MNYEFYIDKSNDNVDILMCDTFYSDRSYKSKYYKDEAAKKLIDIDKNRFRSFKIENNNIIMTDGFTTVKLIDAEEFIKTGYIEFLTKQINKINRTIAKQNENKIIINKKIKGTVITVGLVATMLFAANSQKQKDINVVKTNVDKTTNFNNFDISKEKNTVNIIESSYKEENNDDYLNEHVDIKEENNIIEQNINDSLNYGKIIFEEYKPEQEQIPTAQILVENDNYTKDYAYERCADLVTPIANKWGISPNLIIAQVTQESAAKDMDNLLHIVPSNWIDHIFNEYDFEQNRYRKVVLTDNPEIYESDVTTISREDLKNPKTQISMACLVMRENIQSFDNNILLGLYAYNQGYTGVKNILKVTAENEGIEIQDIIDNPENLSYLKYIHTSSIGDPEYLHHVCRFIDDKVTFKYIDENNEIQEVSIVIDSINNTEEYSHGRGL